MGMDYFSKLNWSKLSKLILCNYLVTQLIIESGTMGANIYPE
jgi:hypothetical protein